MGRKRKELTGKTFGKLTVTGFSRAVGKEDGTFTLWRCKCSCGNEKEVRGSHLLSGHTTSCGCEVRITKPLEGSAFRYVFSQYKYKAKNRGFEWSLTEQQFKTLISSPCFYTGLPPSNKVRRYGETYSYSGVDRVDSSIGYIPENCVSCCGEINKMKLALSKERFLELCSRVAERFSK